jgi:hypothetical protein
MKVPKTSILGEELIKDINQELRESLKVYQQSVDIMDSNEEVAAVRKSLNLTIENINNLRRNHAAVDADVLEAFGTLVKDIKKFNKRNKADLIPIPEEADKILSDVKTNDTKKIDKAFFSNTQISSEKPKPSPTPKVNNSKSSSKQH